VATALGRTEALAAALDVSIKVVAEAVTRVVAVELMDMVEAVVAGAG
jgi:hypothetical protein